MANIVVACGSGVATSETVVSLIKGFLKIIIFQVLMLKQQTLRG